MTRPTPTVRWQVISRGVRAVGVKDVVRIMAAPQDKMFKIRQLHCPAMTVSNIFPRCRTPPLLFRSIDLKLLLTGACHDNVS